MNDNLGSVEQRQEKKTRAWYKCSNCRQKKIKCEPQDRDWDRKKQKCDFCKTHNLCCSPNYKNKDDPGVARPADGNSSSQESREGMEQEAEAGAEAVASTAERANDATVNSGPENAEQGQDTDESSSTGISHVPDRRARYGGLSDERLKAKARAKLETLNVLGVASTYRSKTAPVFCRAVGSPQDYDYLSQTMTSMIKDESHALFVNIYDIGSQADARGCHGDAHEIFLQLELALERYPGLCDIRIRAALVKMALFFQKRDDHYEFEHLMAKVADMYGAPSYHHYQNPGLLLADSFSKTSEKARQVLTSLWQKTYGFGDVPVNLTIPPLQRAAQRPNAEVTASVMSSVQGYYSGPAMFEQEALHIAATQGFVDTVNKLVFAGARVDARDLNHHTPLFLAAANGHELCCLALLRRSADPNVRDSHGHTVLEAAARGAHFSVVQRLVECGALVNSPLACCASTPLQAAIESIPFNQQVALYLLENDADISMPRLCDGQTAIQLAEFRGYSSLAETMRQKTFLLDSLSAQNIPDFLNQASMPDVDPVGLGYDPDFP